MKKIKVLAILMAMTLTFSMFATAASAADVTYSANAYVSLTEFTNAYFNSNLANAKYAALYDFGFDSVTDTKETSGLDHELVTPIVGAANGETSAITIDQQTDVNKVVFEDYSVNYGSYSDDAFATLMDETFKANYRFTSGRDALQIYEGGKIKITFNLVDNMKPVAIGYMATGQRKSASGMTYTHTVDISLSDESLNPSTYTNSWSTNNTLYRFFGYKAPVGEYIESIVIENLDVDSNNNTLRIDDFCVIYEETSKIESGIRFATDVDGYVEFDDIDQLTGSSRVQLIVSPKKGEGKKVLMAFYGQEDNLLWVASAADNAPLTVARYMSNVLKNGLLKTIKAFVWDESTLVPIGVNASIE